MAARPTVEATSLSDLNLLAANPPQYPQNPTEALRDPLTLYIARVPGTRDVILSTLKPQRKNISGEDIANALYYVHLKLPSDDLMVQPTPAGAHDPATASPLSAGELPRNASAIQRKPLPSTAKVATLQPPLTPAQQQLQIHCPDTPVSTQDPPTPPLHLPAPPSHHQLLSTTLLPSHVAPEPWVPPGYQQNVHSHSEAASHATVPQEATPLDPTANPPLPLHPRPSPPSAQIPRKPLGPRPLKVANPAKPQSENVPPLVPAADATAKQLPVATSPARQTDGRHLVLPGEIPAPSPAAARPYPTTYDPPPLQEPPTVKQPPLLPLSPPSPTRTASAASAASTPFQLTLIRRDPSTSNQWNVGKISSVQPADNPATGPMDRTIIQEQPAIQIRLETSGYAKFRGFPSRHSIESALRDAPAAASFPLSLAAAISSPANDDTTGFTRHVAMSYGKSWTANIRQAFKRRDRSSSDVSLDYDAAAGNGRAPGGMDPSSPPLQSKRTSYQGDSIGSENHRYGGRGRPAAAEAETGIRRDSPPPPLITRPGPGLKPKGYVFASPWDGRCEFRTGNGGRSLKCRHIVNASSSGGSGNGGMAAGYNPMVIAQSIRDGQGLAAAAASVTGAGGRPRGASLSSVITGAMPVSELRFNLPSSEIFHQKTDVGTRSDLYGRFHDQLHQLQEQYQSHNPSHHHRRRGSSSATDVDDNADEDEDDQDAYDDEDGYDSALDLSLGRERAGGGARGKRAKLGKLIIFHDGFKMLDLVVAANVGIWWVSWEKSF